MAETPADGLQQAHGLFRFAQIGNQLGHLALGLLRVNEIDRRPGRQLEIGRARHRQVFGDEPAVHAQQRHDGVQAEQPVEIGAADADAAIGEDVVAAVRPRPAFGCDADDGEVRRAAADIGHQHQLLARDRLLVVIGRRDRFVDEGHIAESGLARDLPQHALGAPFGIRRHVR